MFGPAFSYILSYFLLFDKYMFKQLPSISFINYRTYNLKVLKIHLLSEWKYLLKQFNTSAKLSYISYISN